MYVCMYVCMINEDIYLKYIDFIWVELYDNCNLTEDWLLFFVSFILFYKLFLYVYLSD